MQERIISQNDIEAFRAYLIKEEKSVVTVSKYLRDVRSFSLYAKGRPLTKSLSVAWKSYLEEKQYKPRSINSMVASVNRFFEFLGVGECKVKTVRIQREVYSSESRELTKEEYFRLVAVARAKSRFDVVLRTICSTGIRVSELKFFTVEGVLRGEVFVKCKSKTRAVLIPEDLRKVLLSYAKKRGITHGGIFVTRGGKPLDRSYIWAQMKSLCTAARVNPSKVFPHNLRKLFARTFYSIEKDIAKLADVLGHSSIDTTRIYIMSTGMEHRRQIERMGLVFVGAVSP